MGATNGTLPAEIDVLGRVYRVYVGRADEKLRPGWGRVNHALLEIDIRGDLVVPCQWEALFHEAVHSVLHFLLGNANPLDEDDVHTFANGLLTFLKQNTAFQGVIVGAPNRSAPATNDGGVPSARVRAS